MSVGTVTGGAVRMRRLMTFPPCPQCHQRDERGWVTGSGGMGRGMVARGE
jgi:hypothetical protein